MRLAVFILTAFFVFSTPHMAFAADIIGTLVEVEGTATLRDAPAKVDMDVRENDTVATGASSRAIVLFIDGTELVLSENTTVKIDTYIFNPDNALENKGYFSAITGAFRYVSGLIGKNNPESVKVDTPYGSIGMRGTTVWGGTLDDGYGVFVARGAVEVANSAGSVLLKEKEGTMLASATTAPTPAKEWGQKKIDAAKAQMVLQDEKGVRRRIAQTRKRHQHLLAREALRKGRAE